jgi:hypothetical protein
LASVVATLFFSAALKEREKADKSTLDLAAQLIHRERKRERILFRNASIPHTRIEYAGRGASEPIADHASKAGLALDRRADVTMLR